MESSVAQRQLSQRWVNLNLKEEEVEQLFQFTRQLI